MNECSQEVWARAPNKSDIFKKLAALKTAEGIGKHGVVIFANMIIFHRFTKGATSERNIRVSLMVLTPRKNWWALNFFL